LACPLYLVPKNKLKRTIILFRELYVRGVFMDFKCRLKIIFAERDIQQGEFAKKIGLSPAAMSLITNNKSLPTFPVVYKICKELDLRINDIWIEKKEV
jgi:putative transcriptional regulator